MSPFRVLVTGSRAWADTHAITAVLDILRDQHGPALTVVHGACPRGADAIADRWCTQHQTPVERHPADWTTGRAAGIHRNTAMVATGPDLCLAFIRDQSPGASHCAGLAEHAGISTLRNPSPLLVAALGYAVRGWPVFLLGRSKRPVANCPGCPSVRVDPGHDPVACACLTCHGPYAATTDPDRLAAIFHAIPGGLLAVATGTASGIVVVDIDPRHGGTVDPALMPPTLAAATGNNGWHLYYQHPGVPVPNSQGRIAPGVDVRGEGGYAVLPPSIHPHTRRPYQWATTHPMEEMPPPLIAANRPDPAVPATSTPADTAPTSNGAIRGGGGISYPDRLLAVLVDRVVTAPEGRRRTTLYGAARGAARMVKTHAINRGDAIAALTDAGRKAEQTERDIRAAIIGGFRDEGVTV